MSRAPGRTLIPKWFVGLSLSTCCIAFAVTTDTDARSPNTIDAINTRIPPHTDLYLAAEQGASENAATPQQAGAGADVGRGRLLYETHCIVCHTAQAHWRDKHVVKSWADLVYQVTRWQKNAGQDWGSQEINEVAAYLNESFYKLP